MSPFTAAKTHFGTLIVYHRHSIRGFDMKINDHTSDFEMPKPWFYYSPPVVSNIAASFTGHHVTNSAAPLSPSTGWRRHSQALSDTFVTRESSSLSLRWQFIPAENYLNAEIRSAVIKADDSDVLTHSRHQANDEVEIYLKKLSLSQAQENWEGRLTVCVSFFFRSDKWKARVNDNDVRPNSKNDEEGFLLKRNIWEPPSHGDFGERK